MKYKSKLDLTIAVEPILQFSFDYQIRINHSPWKNVPKEKDIDLFSSWEKRKEKLTTLILFFK